MKAHVPKTPPADSLRHAISDLRRKQSHYLLSGSFVEKYVMTPLQLGTIATMVYRLGGFTGALPWPLRWPLGLVSGLLACLVRMLTGIYIRTGMPVGPGFIIHNFSAINIDAESIGENFTVNQGVSIGFDWLGQGRPVIGNNVYFGSGAKALGGIRLGDNVVVAANALVVAPVEDGCTVAGVPARVISRDASSRYLQLKTSAGGREPGPA